MYFQLLKLILWPRSERAPRIITFEPGMVNVITGASKTGKSAVIPIVDYCLASHKCYIPVGVIREKCAWFGIVVETTEGEKLLARREPGAKQSTTEMFVLEGFEVEIPTTISDGNTQDGAVRTMLDRLAGLTQLNFEPDADPGYKSRPSFRDLVSLVFQPQNIVANPNVLFYKADSTDHREKLKSVLPYALKAITSRTIALRHRADRLARQIRKVEAEMKTIQGVSQRRLAEGRTWLTQARELGLWATDADLPHDWQGITAALSSIVHQERRIVAQSIAGIDGTLDALARLRHQEQVLAAEASTHRQRLMEIKRLREGSSEFAGALRVQRERLSLSTWMRDALLKRQDAAALFPSQTAESLEQLSRALSEVEAKLHAHPLASTSLDAEFERQRATVEDVLERIGAVRSEIRAYEASSTQAQRHVQRTASIERFLGGLQQLLVQYEEADGAGEIENNLDGLRAELAKVQSEIEEANIQKRLDSILNEIQHITGAIVPALNIEWNDCPVRLNTKELTVQVSRDGRHDYLWEIGSGANWLAYHIAITLALQAYFLKHPPSPVPSFLVYDQPSQVYFPTVTVNPASGEKDMKLVDQEDIQAVRRIF